jgi:hypothetical protein
LVGACDNACHPVNILDLLSKFFETQKYVYFLMYFKFETWTWIYASRYVEVNMDSAAIVWPLFNSLQAFWPGLQVLIFLFLI